MWVESGFVITEELLCTSESEDNEVVNGFEVFLCSIYGTGSAVFEVFVDFDLNAITIIRRPTATEKILSQVEGKPRNKYIMIQIPISISNCFFDMLIV
ncbi:MAG: hypothetical protein RL536_678 [Candidatus Parcubacteria bacterium]